MTHNSSAKLLRKMSRCIWFIKQSSTIFLLAVTLLGVLVYIFVSSWGPGETTAFVTLGKLRQATLRTTVASLLSVLIVFAIAILWTLSRNSYIGKYTYEHKRVVCAFLVLALLIPVPFLLFKGALSSLAVYVRELLVSGVFVASASITLKVLARVDLNKEAEDEQLSALEKWLREDDVTGWHELWEEVCFGNGLRPAVRLAMTQELQRVRQEKASSQPWSGRNGKYEERLRLLLLSPSEVDKLSSGERVPEKEVASPGYVHSDDFLSHIVQGAPSVA